MDTEGGGWSQETVREGGQTGMMAWLHLRLRPRMWHNSLVLVQDQQLESDTPPTLINFISSHIVAVVLQQFVVRRLIKKRIYMKLYV